MNTTRGVIRIMKRLSKTLTPSRWLLLLLLPTLVNAQGLPDFTELVERNAPAIVNVSTTAQRVPARNNRPQSMEELLREFYGDRMPQQREPQQRLRRGMGSGFIIDSDGYIVTNHHVVDGADEITVTLNDRREFEAELLGSDINSDLALLKIDASGLTSVAISDNDELKVGEWVVAIGSPFGLSYSVSAGIVSYIGRNLPTMRETGNYVSYIQTDVAINPGNSGGPLFNLNGDVVGINSQIFTNSGGSIGLSFAIPTEVARNVINQLREDGTVRRGWMGVSIGEVSQQLAEAFNLDTPHGALVNQVFRDSPAAQAGLQSGDVVVAFNDNDIRTSGDLPYYVGLVEPGSVADVDLIRNGESMSVEMTVGDLESGRVQANVDSPSIGNRLGFAVSEMDADTAREADVDNGVVVTTVLGEAAERAGIQPGDIVLSLDNQQVTSVDSFNRIATELEAGRLVAVLIARQGRQAFFTLRVPGQ